MTFFHDLSSPRATGRLLGLAAVVGVAAGLLAPSLAAAAPAGPLPQTPRPSPACAGATHVVADGDTWYDLAGRFDTSLGSLLGANEASEDRLLHPGDVLCLPDGVAGDDSSDTTGDRAGASCPATHTVSSGDHWYRIAERSGVSIGALLEANEASESRIIHPGEELCLPAGASGGAAGAGQAATYVVASGDHWYGIAQRAGVSTSALLAANEASESRIIHPGEELRLPDGAQAIASMSGSGSSESGSNGSGSGGASSTYTVTSGDSWHGIALWAGVSTRALLEANDANESRLLHPGDVLTLPPGADMSTPSPDSITLDALPMQGPCWYSDSWHAPRGGGRVHVGVDVFASRGSYVYAVVDGTLTSRAWDQPGLRSGNAWWLTAADGSVRYFYAHLDDFAPGLQVGSRVQAGQIIGFMGNTGNSAFPHLHFEIRPRNSGPINPYPIVRAAGGCNSGTPYTQPNGWVPDSPGG